MIDLSKLTLNSVLGHLPLHDFQVHPHDLTQVIMARFERQPSLPGAIVVHQGRLLGLISRQKFLERMSRQFSQEIFLRRSVQVMMDFIPAKPMWLPDRCPIDVASNKVLNRLGEDVYEPIVVVFRDGSLRLLDVHVLLLAQSKMLMLVNRTVQDQKLELELCLDQLKHEQSKVEEANRFLALQRLSIEDRNQLLEQQKAELIQQSQQIARLNQRFVEIGQLISLEGKNAFQATCQGVDAIFYNTDQMIELGKALAQELETLQDTTQMVKAVSKQARFLSLQAAILANRLGSELSGIGRVTSDIGKLSSQTFEAGERMDETATSLKNRIRDLTHLAQTSAQIAQALVQKVVKAEFALTELDDLMEEQDAHTHVSTIDPHTTAMQALMQRIERATLALSELEKMAKSHAPKQPSRLGRRQPSFPRNVPPRPVAGEARPVLDPLTRSHE